MYLVALRSLLFSLWNVHFCEAHNHNENWRHVEKVSDRKPMLRLGWVSQVRDCQTSALEGSFCTAPSWDVILSSGYTDDVRKASFDFCTNPEGVLARD